MFDNFLTKISAQVGLYGTVSFLTFIAVLNPITRIGCGLLIGMIFCYLLAATYISYVNENREINDHKQALHFALSDNLSDFCFFAFFFVLGLFLAIYKG